MSEYFILAQTFAAPFLSETLDAFVEAESPEEALRRFLTMDHGGYKIYSANAYSDANSERKGKKHLAQWLCNHEIEKRHLTKDLGSYSYFGHGPGDFEINGKRHKVKNPFAGKIL